MLGFVENEKAIRDRTAADVAERFNFKNALLHQNFVRLLHASGIGVRVRLLLLAARTERRAWPHEKIQRVVDRLQPRTHFFIERSGEETKLLAHRHHRAAHGDAIVAAVEHFVKPSRDRDKRLAGAGMTITSHE